MIVDPSESCLLEAHVDGHSDFARKYIAGTSVAGTTVVDFHYSAVPALEPQLGIDYSQIATLAPEAKSCNFEEVSTPCIQPALEKMTVYLVALEVGETAARRSWVTGAHLALPQLHHQLWRALRSLLIEILAG